VSGKLPGLGVNNASSLKACLQAAVVAYLLLAVAAIAETQPAGPGIVKHSLGEMEKAPKLEWGSSVSGLRLRISTDRNIYRTYDVIKVTFTIQNLTKKIYPITLALTAEERTDLILIDPSGKKYFMPGFSGPRTATRVSNVKMRPGKMIHINRMLNLVTVNDVLKVGPYRLKGIFRYSGPDMAAWIKDDFTLESNEVSFTIRD
jgi:hypothetical protein